MKYNFNFTRLMTLVFFTCIFLIPNQPAFANNLEPNIQNVNKDVKLMIEADFLNYQKSLDKTKDKFGVSDDESFTNAHLGDGIPYLVVSDSSEANENGFTFDGYIFPIQVNGKPVGIVFSKETNGKWSIVNIKNNMTFEQDLLNARKLLKDTDDAKLVYDPAFGLYALVIHHATGEKSILSMKDNEALKLKKNNLIPIADFQASLHELKKARGLESKGQVIQAGGVSIVDSNSQESTRYLLIGGVVVALGTIVFVMLRRRKQAA